MGRKRLIGAIKLQPFGRACFNLTPVDPLVQQVSEQIRRHRLVAGPSTLIVAVSGGVDSVVLLHLLSELSRPLGLNLVVAHLNHGLRGRASDADQRFVEALAHRSALPFRTLKTDVRQQLRASESIEMAARRVRHAFLSRVQSQRKASAIALAHHADDQMELFFLRLFRGSGGSGLGGMDWSGPSPAPRGGTLIRPLLGTSRQQITEYASRMGLRWREDASNLDRSIPRNRIRHDLIPLLTDHYSPALGEILPRTMEILRSEATLLDALASAKNPRPKPSTQLDAPAREALARWVRRKNLRELGKPATYRDITRIDIINEPRLDKSSNLRFRRGTWSAQIDQQHGSIDLKGAAIHWRKLSKPEPFHRIQNSVEQLDAEKVGKSVTVRRWRPGDRFQPLGMTVPAKLQDLFVNRKIPATERRELWLATIQSGDIFWVEGFPPGERYKVTPQTGVTLRWELTRKSE